MPTVPTKALFDKDIRSPFPLHVTAVPPIAAQPPPPTRTTPEEQKERINIARTDFSQIKRPTPVKAKTSVSVFDLQLPQSDVPHSLRHLNFNVNSVLYCKKTDWCRNPYLRSHGAVSIVSSIEWSMPVPCQR